MLVQAWDFVPGTNWVQGMQDGTRDAARTIAVLSADYLASVYGGAEWQAAWASDPEGAARKLLRSGWPSASVRAAGRVVGVDLFGLARPRRRPGCGHGVGGGHGPGQAGGARRGFPGAGRAMPRRPRFPGALPQVWKVPARNPNFTGRGASWRRWRGRWPAGRR